MIDKKYFQDILDDIKANLEGGFILSRYKGEIYSEHSAGISSASTWALTL